MRHVQRSGNQGRRRTIAGSLALVSGLAMFSVARAPGAIGQQQSAGVTNSGGAVATTGGNSATGNSSTNANNGSATTGGLLGGLVDADVSLGAPTNTSSGTATVNSGAANASGNTAQTGVNQATTGGSNSSFTPFNPFAASPGSNQTANVSNEGDAVASTGGNSAVGNNSENTIGSTQNIGLIDANVGLGGGAANTSTGTANVTSGPANAAGNTSSTGVNQAKVADNGAGGGSGSGAGGGGAGGFFNATPFFPGTTPGTVSGFGSSFDPCSGRFLPFSPFFNSPSGQTASVDNNGTAVADTGGNTAVGNNSTNTSTINQTASGGLIGLNVNLGSPTNNSTGTATVNSGAANASGNQSSNTVNQFCGPTNTGGGGGGTGSQPFARNPITGIPIVVPSIPVPSVITVAAQTGTLARTGFESGMTLAAAALVLFGLGLVITARRRLVTNLSGGTVSSAEWDSVVRW